jgi:hypothetical protein
MRMTDATIGLSIVTTKTAAGYPECKAPTAHSLASSKQCDEGAEYAGQTSEARRAANRLISNVLAAVRTTWAHLSYGSPA